MMVDMMTIKKLQRLEKTCEHIYHWLAHHIKDRNNASVLHAIADDEARHYYHLKSMTKTDVKPYFVYMWFLRLVSRIFGITFGIKLIERKEEVAINKLRELEGHEIFDEMLKDSTEHEQELLDLIDEERLNYLGSVVLGLNDALVELTGALAGFTFAFQNTKLIAVTGLITGISASFSMAASEFLSSRAEGDSRAKKSAIYTGIAYVCTVAILITPYLVIANPYIALATTLAAAVAIIFAFTYYMSITKDLNFKKRFFEMALISLGVATISFFIGMLVKQIFGLEI